MRPLPTIFAQVHAVPPEVRLVALGLLSWALCAGLPWLYVPQRTHGVDLLALASGPGVLGLGRVLLGRGHRHAPWVLLTAFPVAIALGVSRLEHDHALATFSAPTLIIAVLSLGAYGASALVACEPTAPFCVVEHKPLGEVPQVAPSPRRRVAAHLTLATITAGALLGLALGASATPAHYRVHWGQAARAGAVATALGAGILGCVALAMLAPGLRAERAEKRPAGGRVRRVVLSLLVALSSLVSYSLLR